MRPHRCATLFRASWIALLAAGVALSAALPADAQPAAAPGVSVKVLVAVLPFRVHSAQPLSHLETSLADLLSSRLEASGQVEVLDEVRARDALLAQAGERTEDTLRRLARDLGADFVVTGSLTELAGRFSLDVRVTPVDSDATARTMVMTAEDEGELLDRVQELSEEVVGIVGAERAGPAIAEVRFEGAPPDLDAGVRSLLQSQPGELYSASRAREDVELLEAYPSVAGARVLTQQTEAGLVVTFQMAQAEELPAPVAEQAGTREIVEVKVRGNKRIEANAIRARLISREGEPYSPINVAGDVREVYSLGFFRNVRVLAEKVPSGVILIFQVEENPVVRQVSIAGNDDIDTDQIRDALTLTTGSTLDLPLLFENKERVEALYRAQGYYLATVEYEIEEMRGDAVAIVFLVDERDKLRLRRIEFDGNEHFENRQLTKGLSTKTWKWYSIVSHYIDRSGTYSEPVFLQDLQKINERYLNDGFLQVEIEEPQVDTDEEGLVVKVAIIEGDQFNVGEVDVAGDETVDLETLQSSLLLKEGEVFNRSFLTDDVEHLERRYQDRGFFFARVSPRTSLKEDEKLVDVVFEVEKGPLYFIRRIDIAGNTITRDEVIRREMRMVEGQLYSARSIDYSKARVRGLGFFEEVEFEPQQTEHADQLDLDVKVVERPTGSLSMGAGYSTQDQFVISGSLSQQNLFGRGYAVSLNADIGGRSDRFFASFTDPYFLGTEFSLTSQIFRTDVEFDDFDQESNGLEFTLSHALDDANRSRGFLRYSYQDREITRDNNVNASAVIFRELLQDKESTSLLGLAYRSDTRNDRLAPNAGSVLGASVDGAGLGGFSKFLRFEGRGTWFIRPPGWLPKWWPWREKSTFVFAARGGWAIPINNVNDYDLGSTPLSNSCVNDETCTLNLIDDNLELPLSERYFLGGLGTFQLRGYKARSVGPRRALLYDTSLGAFFGDPRRTGFTPVGRQNIDLGNGQIASVCNDVAGAVPNTQGNQNGQCNSLNDKENNDFDDLDETDVIGGNKFISLTAEYRFPISETLGLMGIVFFDTGNAFAEDEEVWEFGKWRSGAGVGVQWFSPFGPLQAFVGIPLDQLGDGVEDNQVFEFSVGGNAL